MNENLKPTAPAESGTAVPKPKPRIVVADDEPGFRKLARYELEGAYEVLTAENGLEAVAHVKAGGVEVVLSDMAMPKMNGLEALTEIKALDPLIEVVIITGYATDENLAEGMRRGAYEFVSKPYQIEDLNRLVGRALAKRRLGVLIGELREQDRRKAVLLASLDRELRAAANEIQAQAALCLGGSLGGLTPGQTEALRKVEESANKLLRAADSFPG